MPSSFCLVSMSAAACHWSGVDVAGSTPWPINASPGRSALSANIPTLPSNAGSNRSMMPVISGFSGRNALTCTGSQPIPVNPDCQAMVNLLPTSYAGSLTATLAFASKFGRLSAGSSTRYSSRSSWLSVSPFVMTMMSHPVDCPAARLRLDLAERFGVRVDCLAIRDLDARRGRELLERGVRHLAVDLLLVDVEGPVREHQRAVGLSVPIDAAVATSVPAAAVATATAAARAAARGQDGSQ